MEKVKMVIFLHFFFQNTVQKTLVLIFYVLLNLERTINPFISLIAFHSLKFKFNSVPNSESNPGLK